VLFRDITPLLGNADALHATVEALAAPFEGAVDLVVGIEARGFILAAPVALRLDAGFVPVRKHGKLPAETVGEEYALEYGTDVLEIHRDGIHDGARVLIVDDVIATGGTALATARLVEAVGGTVSGLAFAIDLAFLGGLARLGAYRSVSLLTYP
jgi:adenine phosphoribosyltransferase